MAEGHFPLRFFALVLFPMLMYISLLLLLLFLLLLVCCGSCCSDVVGGITMFIKLFSVHSICQLDKRLVHCEPTAIYRDCIRTVTQTMHDGELITSSVLEPAP